MIEIDRDRISTELSVLVEPAHTPVRVADLPRDGVFDRLGSGEILPAGGSRPT